MACRTETFYYRCILGERITPLGQQIFEQITGIQKAVVWEIHDIPTEGATNTSAEKMNTENIMAQNVHSPLTGLHKMSHLDSLTMEEIPLET